MTFLSVAPPHHTSMRRCVDAVMMRVPLSTLSRMTDANAERSGVCAEVLGYDYSSVERAHNAAAQYSGVWGYGDDRGGASGVSRGCWWLCRRSGAATASLSRAVRWRKVASAGGQPGGLGNGSVSCYHSGKCRAGECPRIRHSTIACCCTLRSSP